MTQILKFGLSNDDRVELAKRALEKNDVVQHVRYLKEALAEDPTRYDAAAMLAHAYNMLDAREISNDVLFRALSHHPVGENKAALFSQLAVNYIEDDQPEVAEYYLREYSDDFDIEWPEEFDDAQSEENRELRLVYPRGEDYYEGLIEKAYELLREHRPDEAIDLLKDVDPRSKSKEAANHVILVCLMLKENIDAVIENAQRMLREDGDSLVVKCTLATAYLMEDKTTEAYAIVDGILQTDHTRFEDILLILPLLVNLEMHSEVVKYARRVLERREWQPNTMIWLSIALYNIGQRQEALKIMRQVDALYGEYSPARYYIDLYGKEPEDVDYSFSIPPKERMRRIRKLDVFFKLPPEDAKLLLEDESKTANEVRELLEWGIADDNERLRNNVIGALAGVDCDFVERLFRRRLVTSGLSFESVSYMVTRLVDGARGPAVTLDVVAQERFKSVVIFVPAPYKTMPRFLRTCVALCISDIIFTDEEPNEYLMRLYDLVNGLYDLKSSDGRPALKSKRLRLALPHMRSLRTAVGVLLGKVYEKEEKPEEIVERYELNRHTYDKYNRIFFGDDDGREE